MSEIQAIESELQALAERSHGLLQQISELKYRHSLDGNRRSGRDRRGGQDRRGTGLTPERAAGRRAVNDDRRIPLHTRHEVLSSQLSALVARSMALQNWRQNVLVAQA